MAAMIPIPIPYPSLRYVSLGVIVLVTMISRGGLSAEPRFAMHFGVSLAVILTALLCGFAGYIARPQSWPKSIVAKSVMVIMLVVTTSLAFDLLLDEIPTDGRLYESYFLLKRIGLFASMTIGCCALVAVIVEFWRPQSCLKRGARAAICLVIVSGTILSAWGTALYAA